MKSIGVAERVADQQERVVLRLSAVDDPVCGAHQLRRWRCGRVVAAAGRLIEIQHRLCPPSTSLVQVWWQGRYGRGNGDRCVLDYHQPLGMPGFLTLDYIRAGSRAGYSTFIAAARALDEIAQLRTVHAIVAHVTNASISDRLLMRLGWERHLQHWRGRHWIKRFDSDVSLPREVWPTR